MKRALKSPLVQMGQTLFNPANIDSGGGSLTLPEYHIKPHRFGDFLVSVEVKRQRRGRRWKTSRNHNRCLTLVSVTAFPSG